MTQRPHFPGEETEYSWDFPKTEPQRLRTTSSHCPSYRGEDGIRGTSPEAHPPGLTAWDAAHMQPGSRAGAGSPASFSLPPRQAPRAGGAWAPSPSLAVGASLGVGGGMGLVGWVRWAAQHSGASTGEEGGEHGGRPPLAAGPGVMAGCRSVDRWWSLGEWLGEQRHPEETSPSRARALTLSRFSESL